MSRFFRQAGDSESGSSSDESTDSGSEGVSNVQTTTAKPAMSRFLRTADSASSDSESDDSESDPDESEEDGSSGEDRPVRILSAVDKRLKEMEATGKVMDNALKINDWMAMSNGTSSLSNDCILSIIRYEQNLTNWYVWFRDNKTFRSLFLPSMCEHL